METKWLSIQSFQMNQGLLEAINNVLIYLKLRNEGVEDSFGEKRLEQSKKNILNFLNDLNTLVEINDGEKGKVHALTGVDNRFRKLVRSFTEAKTRKAKFRSVLFRDSPSKVIKLLEENNSQEYLQLINALTELRTLVEDHVSVDTRVIIGEI